MATDNIEQVRAMCAAWERKDVDAIMALFTEDAVWHNMPMRPRQGQEAIRRSVEKMIEPAEGIRFEMKNIFGVGDTVVTERIDHFFQNGKDVAMPVAGIFELRDGQIAAWRDYFDLQTWLKQTRD